MERISTRKPKVIGIVIAVLCVAAAGLYGAHVAQTDHRHPSTDDASLSTDLIHVASTIGGRLVELSVRENQHVAKGALLYRIDPRPFQMVVAQAAADLALAQAEVENQQRAVAVKAINAAAATEQVRRAVTDRDLAARTVARLQPLAAQSYIPYQQFDTAQTALRNAEASLAQAKQQQAAADIAIGDLKSAAAVRDARQAALDRARYELEQTEIRAPLNGFVTSLLVRPGEILAPAQALFTLIADDDWVAVGNFREDDLASIAIDACATVFSMIDRHAPLPGRVESIGWGVLTMESEGLGRLPPLVPRDMDWVHVAQRFPVRVRIQSGDPRLLRLGATATIEIGYGAACP
ncbi:multidrug transporter subunit MdtN [Acidisoma sp.]|uniref:multidrug transporter subunit MdtN n=1 Tax=Acidisoma sp. TaxID=1872115 RepID=UPI003AFFB300